MIFAVGLRGTEPDREQRISRLILDTLDSLSRDGLDPRPRAIHDQPGGVPPPRDQGERLPLCAAAHGPRAAGMGPRRRSLRFPRVLPLDGGAEVPSGRRTPVSGEAPRPGISSPIRIVSRCWLPLTAPRSSARLRRRRAEWRRPGGGSRLSEKESALRDARAFKEYQAAPDSPESLALIPSLRRADIPANVERIPLAGDASPRRVCRWRCTTSSPTKSSISTLHSRRTRLAGELSLLLPLFGRAVCGTGLPGIPYHAVALELFRLTGGFSASLDAGGIAGRTQGFGQYVFFRTRCLRHNLRDAVALIARAAQGG